MKRYRLWQASKLAIAITLLGALFLGGTGAVAVFAAAEPLTIKSMTVSVWPEYDNSRILVIYRGEFNNAGSDFPSDVTFLAPQNIEIGQVCALQNGTDHLCQLYESHAENGALTINYNLPIPTFYLEYYYDGLSGSPEKSFSYQFESRYEIDELKVEVQQPLRSSAFKVNPPADSTLADAKGFKYYDYRFENVTPDRVITVDASYNKADSKPSVSTNASTLSNGTNLPLVFGIVGVLALTGATWYLLSRARKRSPQTAAVSRSRSLSGRTQSPAHQTGNQPISFCPYCGCKMEADFRFCPGCGADVEKHRIARQNHRE